MESGQLISGKATSIWMDTAPKTNYPKLSGEVKTAVVVVGGGIAGLSTAYLLSKRGIKPIVIESGGISEGTTGFSTAKITSAHGLIYKYLLDKFGYEKAKIYADSNEAAIGMIEKISEGEGIDCDFRRLPAFTYSVSEDIQNIEEEIWAAKRLSLPVSFSNDLPLPYPVKGAIKYENQAMFHPRKYLIGLAKAIERNGGKIFENSPVLSVEENDDYCEIATEEGKIMARKVVIATNSSIYDPDSFYSKLTSRQSYTIAVKLKTAVPQGMFYSTEEAFHSMRPQPVSPKGELYIIGGELVGKGKGANADESYLALIQWAKENFEVESVEYYWTTSDTESYDKVPMIGRLTPNSDRFFISTAFKGWGMTHGMVAGAILSDLILGKKNDWSELYDPSRFKNFNPIIESELEELSFRVERPVGERPHSAKASRGKEEMTDSNEAKNEEKMMPEASSLENGEGVMIESNGEKIAVYKDDEGKVSAMSAVCTHMGCIVGWNKDEKTWDCPCHGSRFDKEGKVIHGPAVKDLEKRKL